MEIGRQVGIYGCSRESVVWTGHGRAWTGSCKIEHTWHGRRCNAAHAFTQQRATACLLRRHGTNGASSMMSKRVLPFAC